MKLLQAILILTFVLIGTGGGLKSIVVGETNAQQPERIDQTDNMMFNSMKSTKTMYIVALPPEATKGLWWEHTIVYGMKVKYCIVGEKNGQLIIEKEMDLGGTRLIEAWQVDPSVDLSAKVKEGDPLPSNVTKAWIGLPGQPPQERTIMDVPVMKKSVKEDGSAEKFEKGTETINLAGRKWDASWVATTGGKVWTYKGFLLKCQDAEGKTTMELTGWGTDAKAQLRW